MDSGEVHVHAKASMEKKYVAKFIISSLFGLGSFMFPLSFLDNQSLVGFVSSYLASTFQDALAYFAWVLVSFSAIMSAASYFIKGTTPAGRKIKAVFYTKPLYLVTKIVASIFAFLLIFHIDVPIITSEETGYTMLQLGISLITIAIALSYVLPFLTNCGIMELFGVLTKDLITPLFKVPGVASLDLITSWFGASNAEVIVCREKYRTGYYSKRETANIMSNFSLVSVSFCYVVTRTAGLSNHFTLIFGAACVISVILAIIMPRIPPLSRIPNTYFEEKKEVDASVPKGWTSISWGVYQGSLRAKEFSGREIISNGTSVMLGIWFELIPVVIAWGTLGLVLVYHTPVFTWISYPIGAFFSMLGMESAFIAAPAALVGFIDMFIPSLLIAGVESAKTRFIITLLSLVQMIYLTEVGSVMMQSEIDLNLPRILIIFLERTLLAFPIIYFLAHILF